MFGNRQPIDLDHRRDRRALDAGGHADGVVIVGVVDARGRHAEDAQQHQGARARRSTSRTGKRLWTFNTIPRPGEFGNDTWLNDSWAVNGNTGVWNQISVDEELGLAYLPVETPTSDFYGGHRPGNNLFAESIVAVDLKTGQRKWHYQLVHHSHLELRHRRRRRCSPTSP